MNHRQRGSAELSWQAMMARCYNQNSQFYQIYGGRGIKVCERWHTIEYFLEDMGPRPAGTTIDRLDNDGNYEPSNCQWANHKEQARKRSHIPLLEVYGAQKCAAEWEEISGTKSGTIRARLRRGWTAKEAVFGRSDDYKPPGSVTIEGVTRKQSEWSAISGVPDFTISDRLERGWEPHDAVWTPTNRT
jgi:hypothetical protein